MYIKIKFARTDSFQILFSIDLRSRIRLLPLPRNFKYEFWFLLLY